MASEIDGAPEPLLRANVLFRAVKAPAGRHEVRFVFRPFRGVVQALGLEAATGRAGARMSLLRVYVRAIQLLAPEKRLAIALAAASVAIATVQLAEPILFGRVVDALAKGRPAGPTIALWAALGLVGILAGVVVAVFADRLAHGAASRRWPTPSSARSRCPSATTPSAAPGSVVRAILSGTDGLFWMWLSALRDQLTAAVGILFLVPTAISMDVRMAAILGALARAYTVLNLVAIYKTYSGQSAVERYHGEVSGRVGDVLGNVTIVQSYARLAAEAQAMRSIMGDLLAAQYRSDLVGAAAGADARGGDDHHGRGVRGGRPRRARRALGRRDRELHRLRQPADRQLDQISGFLVSLHPGPRSMPTSSCSATRTMRAKSRTRGPRPKSTGRSTTRG